MSLVDIQLSDNNDMVDRLLNFSSTVNLMTYADILTQPWRVTYEDLIAELRLKKVPKNARPDGKQKLYIRSFPMQKRQLTDILREWIDKEVLREEMEAWGKAVDLLPRDTSVMFLRYVSSTARTSWARHWKDVVGLKSGLMASFL
jgi:phytoene dehydrogenase-like protein